MALVTWTLRSSLLESKIIFIDNLVDKQTRIGNVEKDLSKFGEIVSIWTKVQQNPTSYSYSCSDYESIGFVFVEFESKMATQAAKHWLNGRSFTGGDCIARVYYASQLDIDNHAQLIKFDKKKHSRTWQGKIVEREQPTVNQQVANKLPALPEEVLLKILKYSNNSSLLTQRLVCRNWKNIIDNSLELMRKLTFRIYDLDSFQHSTITGKVKNIVFENGTALPINLAKEFFVKCGPSLEKAEFGFSFSEAEKKHHRICRQGRESAQNEISRQYSTRDPAKRLSYDEEKKLPAKMIKKALKSSSVIKELQEEKRFQRIMCSFALKYCINLREFKFPPFCCGRRHLFNSQMDEAERASIALSTINKLSVNTYRMSKRDFGAVKELISGLPQLSVLKFYGGWAIRNPLAHNLCQFLIDLIENGPQPHVLKKIEFDAWNGYFHVESDRKIWIQLLMKAAQFSVMVESPVKAYLNNLIELQLELREQQDFPMEATNAFSQLTKATILIGTYNYNDNKFLNRNTIIEKCCGNNLVSLEIVFYGQESIQHHHDVSFLPHLRNLEELKIYIKSHNDEVVGIPQEILQWEMDSLKSLRIRGSFNLNLFLTNQMQTFAPNLTHLTFRHLSLPEVPDEADNDIPQDLILSLAGFVHLVSLEFRSIYDMTENAFIRPCPTTNLPAIATLEHLKQLTLYHCDAAVNNCRILADGISYCPSLEELTITPDSCWICSSTDFDSKILQEATTAMLNRAGLSRKKKEQLEHECHRVYNYYSGLGFFSWKCFGCDERPATATSIIFSK